MKAPAYSTLIIALLIAVAAVVFAFQNDAEVTVRFIKWTAQGSVATLLLTTFVLGVAATTLALLPTVMKAIGQASAAKRSTKNLKKEIESAKEHAQELVVEVARARGATEQAQLDNSDKPDKSDAKTPTKFLRRSRSK